MPLQGDACAAITRDCPTKKASPADAGKALTREEITLAWLKVGWLPEKAENKTAGQCLEELRTALGDRGLRIEADEIVRLISFVWAVECRGGTLLDSKDLLKGEIVRSMAASVAATWTKLEPRVESCADLIKERDLLENQGSFNAIIVYLTWYRLAFDRFDAVAGRVSLIERDSLEKQLNLRAAQFLDRWVFGSQWANVWGDGAVLNFQNFASELRSSTCWAIAPCWTSRSIFPRATSQCVTSCKRSTSSRMAKCR